MESVIIFPVIVIGLIVSQILFRHGTDNADQKQRPVLRFGCLTFALLASIVLIALVIGLPALYCVLNDITVITSSVGWLEIPVISIAILALGCSVARAAKEAKEAKGVDGVTSAQPNGN